MNNHLIEKPEWKEYELLDSGDREKLERFGEYTFVRPEPKAIWQKSKPALWEKADAIYKKIGDRDGRWQFNKSIAESWKMQWNNISFRVKPTSFKHTGIFPESAVHWSWIQQKLQSRSTQANILNLFAYTGGCTLAALASGAQVTHLDASKEIVSWAHENAQASGLHEKPVRWIVDDAMTFVKREIKRGKKYDGIILDPPKFGRAENGKVWKFEQDFPHLLELCQEILTPDPLFILINTYTVEFSAVTLHNLLYQATSGIKGLVEHGEIVLPQTDSDIVLPTSIFARWSI